MSKASDMEGFVEIAVVGVGLFLGYKLFQAIKTGAGVVGAAVGAAQQSAGSAVADLFPNNIVTPGSGQTYTVTMPDGSTQQVVAGQLPVPSSSYVAPYDSSLDADFSAGNF